MIHENPAHHLCGDTKEVSAIPPISMPLVNQPQVDLVNQGRWLKGVPNPFTSQLPCGNSTQLRVDERKQLVEGVRVAAPPVGQQGRHIWPGSHLDFQMLER